MKIDSVGFWSNPTLGKADGFGYAGYKFIKYLEDYFGLNVYWRNPSPKVAVSFVQPHMYGGTSSQFRIGYTPWESTLIPQEWVEPMNNQDVIWTTSEYCKNVFEDNGITNPIKVVWHGIDDDYPLGPMRKIEDKFTFFHMGEPADRKNGQMVVDAFLTAFPKDDNVRLILKAHAYCTARLYEQPWSGWETVRNIIGPVYMHPRIGVYTDEWPIENIVAALHQVNCMVYPSSGEGFGLLPLQAMATGLPTIFPYYSGLADFAPAGIPLEYTIGPSNHGYHLGDWCWPSFDDLVDKMREVYSNYEFYSKSAYQMSSLLRQKFHWPTILKRAFEEIGVELDDSEALARTD